MRHAALNMTSTDIDHMVSVSTLRQSPMTSSPNGHRRQRPLHGCRCWNSLTAVSVLLLAVVLPPAECGSGPYTTPAACTSYCSESNNYVQSFYCTSFNPYCCGNENTRYCCNNQSLSLGDQYPNVCYTCFSSPCGFMSDWSAILLSVAVVLSLAFFIGCFCHCLSTMFGIKPCKVCCPTRTSPEVTSASAESGSVPRSTSPASDSSGESSTRSGRRRQRRGRRSRQVESADVPSIPSDFNPDHPFAFRPPDYDQLSMTIRCDPPKYEDDEYGGGTTNIAFANSEMDLNRGGGTDEPPPLPDFDDTNDAGVRRGEAFVVINVNAVVETNVAEEESPPPPYEDAVMTSSSPV